MRSSTARIAAIVVVFGLGVAAVLVTSLAIRPSSPAVRLTGPIVVKRALSTSAAFFGDTVGAEVDVVSRDATVPPGSVRVSASFAPFAVVSRSVERMHAGGASLMRTTLTLQCLARTCLPPAGGVRPVQLSPVVVRYAGAEGAASLVIPWPQTQVSSRVPRGATRVGLVDTAPPLDPRFARSPDRVRLGLVALTVLLVIAGTALLVSALWPEWLRRRNGWATLAPLEQSLRLVEAAAGGTDEAERRRTLDQLALRLDDVPAPQLEARTRALAWGEAPPEPSALTDLAAEVRRTLNGKVQA